LGGACCAYYCGEKTVDLWGGAMFVVGALRALIANVRWWKAGIEMLSLGAVVALLAYASGGLVARLVEGV
jgi:VIT1/CCC1 family predicted Fe2+/Mn2+ transporter